MPVTELTPDVYSLVDMFSDDDHRVAEDFHETTKLTRTNGWALRTRIERIRRDPALVEAMRRAWKTYPGAPRIPLPEAALPPVSLEDALLRRRSHLGAYEHDPIDARALGSLLRYAMGPTVAAALEGACMHLRANASAGGLHPVEAYLYVRHGRDLDPGLYHYAVADHHLERIDDRDLDAELRAAAFDAKVVATASAVIILTALFRRNYTKYLHRGYRFVAYDTGTVVQNLYLVATGLGLGACAVGGFYDDDLAALLGVDGLEEAPLMLFTVGGRNEGGGP